MIRKPIRMLKKPKRRGGKFCKANLPACIGLKSRDIHSVLRTAGTRISIVHRKAAASFARSMAIAAGKLNGKALTFEVSSV